MCAGQRHRHKEVVTLGRSRCDGSIRNMIRVAMLSTRHAHRQDGAFINDHVLRPHALAVVRIHRK